MSESVEIVLRGRDRHMTSSLKDDGDVADWFALLMIETITRHGGKIDEARTRIYATDLAEFSPQQVVDATRRVSREGSGFFPASAEIRAAIVGKPDDAALLAWSAFERAAIAVGSFASLEVEDPVAAAALISVFGSWPNFCATPQGPDLAIKRQAFLAAFRQARREQPTGATALRCAGLLDVGKARLTARGEIVHERERPASLPAAAPVPQLTAGAKGNDGDGETIEAGRVTGDGAQDDQGHRRGGRRLRRSPRRANGADAARGRDEGRAEKGDGET